MSLEAIRLAIDDVAGLTDIGSGVFDAAPGKEVATVLKGIDIVGLDLTLDEMLEGRGIAYRVDVFADEARQDPALRGDLEDVLADLAKRLL